MFIATKGVHDTRDDQKTAMLGKLEGRMEMDNIIILHASFNHFVLFALEDGYHHVHHHA